MSSRSGLPLLSSAAWAATLVAALLALSLGVYPFVASPTVQRHLPDNVASTTRVLVSPAVAACFAALTVVAMVLALSGARGPRQRSALAYAALGIAVVGVALLVAGLRAISPAP